MASSSRARASASLRRIFRIRRAASVRLSMVVRCGKRLNCWKTIPTRCRTLATSAPLPRDLLAFEVDAPLLDRLEEVHAAQQRALAAPARADDHEHLAVRDAQVDPVEDEVVAEALADAFELHHRRPVGGRHRTLGVRRLTVQQLCLTRVHQTRPMTASQALTVTNRTRTLPRFRRRAKGEDVMKVACATPLRLASASV